MAVAAWSFKFGQIAGRGTDTLSASKGRYIPLMTPRGVVGVLSIKPKEERSPLTPDQRRLLETFSRQAALAIERAQLAEQARRHSYYRLRKSSRQPCLIRSPMICARPWCPLPAPSAACPMAAWQWIPKSIRTWSIPPEMKRIG